MRIVESTVKDLQTIQKYQKQLHAHHKSLGLKQKLSSVVVKDETDYHSLNVEGVHFFKIQEKGKIIGLLTLRTQSNICRVMQLFITEVERRKGYSTAILNYLCNMFDEVSLGVYKKNINALNLYRHLGFSIYKEHKDKLDMKK